MLLLEQTGFLLVAQGNPLGPIGVLWPLVVIVLLYIFLVHRPQQRERDKLAQMLKNLKKNDRVVTTSGIYGVVTNVQTDADEVTIRVDETSNTKLRMRLGSIANVLADESDEGRQKDPK